jgi:glucosamine-6-phosphate deaminase
MVGGPSLLVVDDHEALSRVATEFVVHVIEERPASTVVVATGRTPMGLYAGLAERAGAGRCDVSRIIAVQLDEYLGLGPHDRRSLFLWMRRSFVDPLAIDDERVVRLPLDGDLAGACAAFDRGIEARGGLDLAILGLGPNGHLGFNEPPSDRTAPTRRVELSPVTIEANARYWGTVTDVPNQAVTLGLASLLAARRILLLVSGEAKRGIVHRAIEGAIGPEVPASFLQEAPDVTVIVDRAAWGGAR